MAYQQQKFITILEAGEFKIKLPIDVVSGDSSSWFFNSALALFPHTEEGESDVWDFFLRI